MIINIYNYDYINLLGGDNCTFDRSYATNLKELPKLRYIRDCILKQRTFLLYVTTKP